MMDYSLYKRLVVGLEDLKYVNIALYYKHTTLSMTLPYERITIQKVRVWL